MTITCNILKSIDGLEVDVSCGGVLMVTGELAYEEPGICMISSDEGVPMYQFSSDEVVDINVDIGHSGMVTITTIKIDLEERYG